ncbi:MAG TPA: hypothetical protein VL947_10230 [Cytophagales bacterium]|nr:hypothetical protein [Cytophagales bacterium]
MTKIVLSAVLLTWLGLASTSCAKKASDPVPSNAQTKAYLTSGSWITVKTTIKKRGTDVDSLSSTPTACEADNFSTWKSDGSYTIDEGALKCNASDPQIEHGDYTLSDDGKTLIDNDLPIPFQILEVSDTKLVLKVAVLYTQIIELKKK